MPAPGRRSRPAARRAANAVQDSGRGTPAGSVGPTGYCPQVPSADSRIGRAVQKVAKTRAFAATGAKVFPPVDRVLNRLTGGRVVLSASLVPSLVLTTTGRKTGQPRQTPLATRPVEDGFLVVGSNFGKEHHPAWTANLLANPNATVTYKGETIPVVARLLDPEQKAAVWPDLLRIWPAWTSYTERSGRDLRVFRLEPERGQS
ncbi:MAG: nitroreductase family deazaflavin-dependent oxidoreductase, partial [Acidimicrobiia bacterium]|nr:nitroreductase family deazaflavin-dependent oxidoreductase [Acidimicrobiia bacterium]